MLADQLDYIVGVDPHRDSHALAIVQVVSGAVVFESTVDANSDGYARSVGARRASMRQVDVRSRSKAQARSAPVSLAS